MGIEPESAGYELFTKPTALNCRFQNSSWIVGKSRSIDKLIHFLIKQKIMKLIISLQKIFVINYSFFKPDHIHKRLFISLEYEENLIVHLLRVWAVNSFSIISLFNNWFFQSQSLFFTDIFFVCLRFSEVPLI